MNGQTFEPFNSAFNAVNMSYVQIKGSIRQARCAGFKNKLEPKENSLPFRKKEVSLATICALPIDDLKWLEIISIKLNFLIS